MISLTSIEMYNLLRTKIGEKEAQAITEYISVQVKDTFLAEKEHFATREDLIKEIGLVRKEVAEAKTDTIKWMFIFWVGQLAATAGIVFAILSIYFRK